MSDPRYQHGDVVWCKCGGLFWPGEVKGLSSLPEEIREGFLRMPLVVVKFFDEDGYEFVETENNIFPYNCEKKTQFISKGLARFRTKSKEGATEGWFAKFPKDVIHCEKVTGGNQNILDEPPFTVEKKEVKVDYAKIFSDGKEKEKKKELKSSKEEKDKKDTNEVNTKKIKKLPISKENKSKSDKLLKSTESSKKSKKTSENKTPVRPITHPRFLQGSDHQVRILAPPSTPFHLDSLSAAVSSPLTPNYRCPVCDFVASRLNVIVLHSKTHSASKVSYAVKNVENSTKSEKSKTNISSITPAAGKSPVAKAIVKSSVKKRERPVTKQDKKSTPVSKKPRLTKKEREERKEKEKKKEEEKNKILFDWSEDDDEEEKEFKKIQDTINQSLQTEDSEDEADFLAGNKDDYLLDSDDEAPLINNRRPSLHLEDEEDRPSSTLSKTSANTESSGNRMGSPNQSPVSSHASGTGTIKFKLTKEQSKLRNYIINKKYNNAKIPI